MEKQNLLSIRKYALRRGVTLRAVQKAIETKRISTVEMDGKRYIDPDLADVEWEISTQERINSSADIATLEDYQKSRAEKEYYQAKLAKLEYLRKSGELLDANEVQKRILFCVGTTREVLLNIPEKIGPELVGEKDVFNVTAILKNEIQSALESLSRMNFIPDRRPSSEPKI